jgi:hypothetical protein
MGEQYPEEVDPFSSCCWWLLGQFVAGLRSRPGGTLHFRRLYTLWNEHTADLRSDLGAVVANGLLAEAVGVDQLDQQDALLFVAQRRPG